MDLGTFSLKQGGKRRTATRVVGILMKSLQVTQEQLHVLEQFLAADLPAATPGECVAWRKTLLQADAAIAKVAKVPTMAFSSRVGSIEQPFDPKMKQFLLGSSVRQFHGQPVGSRCSCSLR